MQLSLLFFQVSSSNHQKFIFTQTKNILNLKYSCSLQFSHPRSFRNSKTCTLARAWIKDKTCQFFIRLSLEKRIELTGRERGRSIVRLERREGFRGKGPSFRPRITHDYTVLSSRLTTPLSPPSMAKIYRQSAELPARIYRGKSPRSP